MHRMIHINSTITIHRPVRQIFNFVSSTENDTQWQYGILASHRHTQNPIGLGMLFSSLSHFMGRRLQSKFEVTEYEPNRRYGFVSRVGPIQLQSSYTFEIFQGGTQVKATLHINQGGYFRLPDSIVARFAKKQLKENLTILKNILELV
jgi:hypothetical protein